MSLDHPDHAPYKKFVRRQIVDKSIHTLHGMLTGISLDSMIVKSEVVEVLKWAKEYKTYVNHPPFNEIIPKIEETFRCEKIDEETHRDLIWLCENISLNGVYYDKLTHDIQILHGIMHGILADGVITLEELKSLEKWIEEHDHLKGSYPYDELESQIMSILSDGKVSEEEAKSLNEFFTDFINYSLHRKIK